MTTSSNSATWLEDNSLYLSAAIAWLRLQIESCIAPQSDSSGEAKSESSTLGKKEAAPRTGKALPSSLQERIAEARLHMDSIAGRMKSSPALVFLAEAFGLSNFESEIVLLCAAVEFDPSMMDLYARVLRRTPVESISAMPTFALALTALDDPAWDALSPDAPLRYWRLIDVEQPGFQSLSSSPLRAEERVVNFLKGLNRLDDRLVPFLTPLASAAPGLNLSLPASQQVTADAIATHWRSAEKNRSELSGYSIPLIQLIGPDYPSKQNVATTVTADLGRRLFRLAADALPTAVSETETLSRLWQRENRLLPLALFVDAQAIDALASEAQAAATRRFISRAPGFNFLCTRDGWSGIGYESYSFEVASPTRDEQRLAWLSALGPEYEISAGELASQFNLPLSEIQRIAYESSTTQNGDETRRDLLWDSCLAKVRPVLDKLARRIDTRAGWQDIVLPEEQELLLRQITAQVRERATVYEKWGFSARMNRGLGISALFTGESGTGKTMAAEVIARDLRLNLYRIDLSAVVSKYIGETEKNLSHLFDAAESGGAILFFDEADALFGKRSEIRYSNDRYANIEINYLLQRMESYSGLAILATNLRSALDAAFTRRLRFVINFPFPSVADRRRMWMKAYPATTPVHQLDYDRLARFNLTGGSITNAAINSAFLAAHTRGEVTMALVLSAIRQEFVKLDRPINRNDFVWLENINEQEKQPPGQVLAHEPRSSPPPPVPFESARSTRHKTSRKEQAG